MIWFYYLDLKNIRWIRMSHSLRMLSKVVLRKILDHHLNNPTASWSNWIDWSNGRFSTCVESETTNNTLTVSCKLGMCTYNLAYLKLYAQMLNLDFVVWQHRWRGQCLATPTSQINFCQLWREIDGPKTWWFFFFFFFLRGIMTEKGNIISRLPNKIEPQWHVKDVCVI